MANEFQIREQICEIGRRLYAKGFVAANDGNISYRLNEKEILCTPTLVSKGFMKPEDMCKVDLEGKQISGTRKRSSEILMHLTVYKHRPDIKAVVHCHAPHAVAFALVQEPLPQCILPEVEFTLGEVPIAVYETPGGQKFADTIIPHLKATNTILLSSHGTVTYGQDLEKAYWYTEIIDAYCRILILAKQVGNVKHLAQEKVKELLESKKKAGLDDIRFHRGADCDLCANTEFGRGYSEGVVEPTSKMTVSRPNQDGQVAKVPNMEQLVQLVTDQVMSALAKAG